MPEEWLAGGDLFVYKQRKAACAVTGQVCLVPYSMLETLSDKELLDPAQFGLVIADESHNLKSIGTKRTSHALPFLRGATVTICLTGTPVLNRPVELFSQLEGLLPEMFSPHVYGPFTKRYCDAKPHRFRSGEDVSGTSNESELKVILEGVVMIRRLKKDVLDELPDKKRELIYVEPDPVTVPQLVLMRKRMEELAVELENGMLEESIKKQKKNEQQGLLNKYCQVSGMAKIPGIKRELLALIEQAAVDRAMAESLEDCAKGGPEGARAVDAEVAVVDFTPAAEEEEKEEKEREKKEKMQEEERKNVRNRLLEDAKLFEIEDDIVTKSEVDNVVLLDLDLDMEDGEWKDERASSRPPSRKRLRKRRLDHRDSTESDDCRSWKEDDEDAFPEAEAAREEDSALVTVKTKTKKGKKGKKAVMLKEETHYRGLGKKILVFAHHHDVRPSSYSLSMHGSHSLGWLEGVGCHPRCTS